MKDRKSEIQNPNQTRIPKAETFRLGHAAFCFLLSALCFSAFGQGTAFTYQGRLDDGGSPASGVYDLRFALFNAASAGTAQGSALTNAATTVSNGLFTVTLNFGNQFPGADRWLEIGVRTNGGGAFIPLHPRQPLTATPYAIAAGNLTGTLTAANIANGSISGAMLAAGAVGSNQLALGAVTTSALADGAVTGQKLFAPFNLISSVVLTNPTPFALDRFGFVLAAVGTDTILVGAHQDDAGATNAGVAYLFHASGHLLTSITNPTPAPDDNFGRAVAAFGPDKLLVGASLDDTGAFNAGSAYLYNTNGTLLLTITNPSPANLDQFGAAVTMVGATHFLVGSPSDFAGGGQFGAAFLYDATGSLVLIFTNPTPANLDSFGGALTAVGADKVLIGAPADDLGDTDTGVAYLFDLSGNLLTTYTSPSPVARDNFGLAVAAVGADKVLIGAPLANLGAPDAGAAYLFDLSGNLLATFANPTPAVNDFFGGALTGVGADTVLIGARTDGTLAFNGGAAYLFDLSGRLLSTVTNPAPGVGDQFATAVAVLDEHRLILGAPVDDRGVADAGGVFVLRGDRFTPGLIADQIRDGAVNSASLANGAVTSEKIADGSITTADLTSALLTSTFWRLDGNSGTSPGFDFIGTKDAAPLVFRANNRKVLELDATGAGTRLIVGQNNSLGVSSTNSSILGGRNNTILSNAPDSTIVGGQDNEIQSFQRAAFIGGGERNEIGHSNQMAVIVGGRDNRIGTNTVISMVVGGAENRFGNNVDGGVMVGGFRNDILGATDPGARQIAPVILGGSDNQIGEGRGSSWSVIIGGDDNRIGTNCASAVILGGTNNLIADNAAFSLAAGRRARANHPGAFVWGDSFNGAVASSASNQFTLRASGGVRFFSNTGLSAGVSLAAGGTAWAVISDRTVKKDFAPVDSVEVLEKLAALPISQWRYDWETAEVTPHIGPMAQDFKATFYPGADDKVITTQEADGVALAAIQGLNQKLTNELKRRDTENAELKARLEALEQLIQQLTTKHQ